MKHLNPRQGITTQQDDTVTFFDSDGKCETPKSPPGDYNLFGERASSFNETGG